MKKRLVWFALLNKRLFKRVSFWLILAAVPALVLALSLLSGQESGVTTVAVYAEDASDPAAGDVLRRLEAQKSVVRFLSCDSEREAKRLVQTCRADTAWILPADLSERIDQRGGGESTRLVTVYAREGDDILRSLTREKLFAALYPTLAYNVYTHYVLDTLRPDPAPSAQELERYYHSIERHDRLIELNFLDGSEGTDTGYLVMPARGLLALLVMMAALASALYYLHDEASDSFVWVPRRRRRLLPYLCHLIPALDTAVVVVAALLLSGLGVAWYHELALMALYVLACVAFSELMRQLAHSTARLGVAIPILMLAMLALSPIFFDLRRYRVLQLLCPPFYYLNGAHNPMYLAFLAAYALAAFALSYALGRLRERFARE